MKRTELLQGIRTMKFEDIYERTAARELSQVEAADICTFLLSNFPPRFDAAEGYTMQSLCYPIQHQ
jgi:hypothetical protein